MIITDKEQLLTKCKDVSLFEYPSVIKELKNELSNSPNAIGLAANQIGINARVCIVKVKTTVELVNPFIVERYDLMEFEDEACLSFPDQHVLTKRFNEIFVKDILHVAGIIFTGLEAVAVQHEIDHLNGKTMFDYEIIRPRMNDKCWCGLGKKYKKCHNGKTVKV